jgi:hypothetical protein
MADVTKAELTKARRRGDELAKGGIATSVEYDESRNRVVIMLSTGIEIAFDPRRAQGLAHASAADLKAVEIQGAGFGVYWPRLDADIYIPALMQGIMGTKKWVAGQLGAAAGGVRSTSKAAGARESGKQGGRRVVRA